MERLGKWWKRIPVQVRKPLVFIVGFAIIVTGLGMLVLPGPGWAAIFVGLAVLATEFAFAERARAWLVGEAKRQLKNTRLAWRRLKKEHRDKRDNKL